MAGEDKFKTTVTAGVHTVRELTKNDFWIKSEEGRDVLVKDKYRQAFRFKINTLSSSSSCTTEASRASALVHMDDEDLALMLAVDEWSYWFPNIVAKEQLIKILSPGSSDENPHGTLHMVYKEMQATSPMVANRKFTVLRTCLQIDQGTWVIAELSHVSPPNTYRRLPSGCLIERITEDVSKVTWVEHMEVDEPLPNRSGFAFAAERMVAWLERSCERGSDMNATCRIKDPQGKEVPWTLEKLSLMWFGESMVRGLFENVGPNEDCHSTLWRSVTGSEDMKVYASLYKSSANFEVAGGVVTFGVRHSPELVLETLGDERTHHEVLLSINQPHTLTQACFEDLSENFAPNCLSSSCFFGRINPPRIRVLSGGDTRNSISASMIDGSTSEILIKEVNVNRSGSLVLWSTVSMKDFDVMSHGRESPEDSALISGFSITTNGHTAATNTGGSVITLVLRKLVEGNQPLQEKRLQSIESITFAINQTVGRVKQALEKHQPPSPGGDWPTEKQLMQDELRMLKLVLNIYQLYIMFQL
ncbi:START domain-containing protein [Tanacetum coccineum]